VYGFAGHVSGGALSIPENTMFHTPPFQLVQLELRVKNCCCAPEATAPSTCVSAM
jgi:hypothetical protein